MSSFFPNQEALAILYRKGTQDDPFVSVEENIKVTNNRVFLKEIPDDYTKVTVETLQGVPLYETLEKSPSVNNYYVDYRLGICVFNEAQDGQSLNFTYLGKGMTFVNSSRVYIEGTESDPVKTLQDIVDESTTQVSDAAQTIVDTETARQNAITATTNAQVQGDYAKSVADTNKNQWKLPVANFAAIATTYPSPTLGDRVITLDTNKEYRYQNGSWEYIAGNSTTAIGDAQNKIGDLSVLQTTDKTSLVKAINSNTTQLADIVTVLNYGAVGDYNTATSAGTDNTQAFLDAITEAKRIGGRLLIPSGNYYISQDIEFPSIVICINSTIIGGKVKFTRMQDLSVKGLRCQSVHFSGIWRGDIEVIKADSMLIDGSIDWYGTFWNQFTVKFITEMTIDISEGAVNQNQFTGGRINNLRVTGTATKYPNSCEAQNNWFTNVDISTGGALQDDAKMQTNYLVNCYSENGTNLIRGNWQVLGNTGQETPSVGLNSHILFANDAVPRSSQDFLSLATTNLVEGGEWESLDTKGRPKGVTYSSATAVVVVDATAPDGSGKAVKVDTSTAFGCFVLNLKNFIYDRGSIVFFAKGDIATMELINSTNGVTGGVQTSVDVGNGWKLYRVTIPKTANITKLQVYLTTTAVAKTAYFAGIKALPFKANLLPYYRQDIYCRGSLPSVPTEGIWRKGEFVTNSDTTANATVAGWLCTNDSPLTFSEMVLKTNSFMTKKIWQKSVTDTNQIVAKISNGSYSNGAIVELSIRYTNDKASSPDFLGYVGTAKYLIALAKENTTVNQTVTPVGTAIADYANPNTDPTVTVVNSGGYWNINVVIPAGQGITVCNCEADYYLESGTTITFLTA
jgi:hypothetical protein